MTVAEKPIDTTRTVHLTKRDVNAGGEWQPNVGKSTKKPLHLTYNLEKPKFGIRWNNITGKAFHSLHKKRRVCFVTQSSVERLHEIIEYTDRISGPLSMSTLLPGTDYQV